MASPDAKPLRSGQTLESDEILMQLRCGCWSTGCCAHLANVELSCFSTVAMLGPWAGWAGDQGAAAAAPAGALPPADVVQSLVALRVGEELLVWHARGRLG